VINILGEEIATIMNEQKHSGEYTIEFNADKYNLASGVYFYRLTAKLLQLKDVIAKIRCFNPPYQRGTRGCFLQLRCDNVYNKKLATHNALV